jgi:hypothetical protein
MVVARDGCRTGAIPKRLNQYDFVLIRRTVTATTNGVALGKGMNAFFSSERGPGYRVSYVAGRELLDNRKSQIANRTAYSAVVR